MDTGEVLDLTKENILPLSKGRITSQFGAALHAQTNTDIQQELRKTAENFELSLRTYEGDDPLSVWYDYILWIEQSFPKGGKEGNLQVILEKCLTKFRDDPKYTQDSRHIRLWTKYFDVMVDVSALELYSMLHGHGVGTQSALFYRKWASEYEKCQDFKNADKIYQLGFERNAQPKEELVKAHTAFLQTFMRLTLYGGLPSPPRADATDERQVLNALRPHGRNSQAPNVRVGRNVLHGDASKAPLLQPNANKLPQSTLKIFTDENGAFAEPTVPADKLRSMPRPTAINKENSLLPGTWNNPAGRKSRAPPAAVLLPAARPAFLVHKDEVSNEAEPAEPAVHNVVLNALKTIKQDTEFNCPCVIFDPPDPTKRSMYAKHKVYEGGSEFSFEELRAAKYIKKEAEKRAQELQLSAQAVAEPQELSRNSMLYQSTDDLKLESFQKLSISSNVSAILDAPEKNMSHCQSEEQQSRHFAIAGVSGPASLVAPSSSHGTLTAGAPQLAEPPCSVRPRLPQGRRKTMGPSEVRPPPQHCSPASKHMQHSSCNESSSSNEPSMLHSQSITVNTKEAMNVMNELWGSSDHRVNLHHKVSLKPADDSNISRASEEQVCLPSNINPFEIFTDNCETNDVVPSSNDFNNKEEQPVQVPNTVLPFEIFSDAQAKSAEHDAKKPLGFVIYEEEDEENEPLAAGPALTPPIPFVPSPGMTSSELRSLAGTDFKENHNPVYHELSEEEDEREMAGILQPSATIPFQPLDTEVELEQDNELCDAKSIACVTQNFTQAFKFPLYSSTPFHGKPPSMAEDNDRLDGPEEDEVFKPRLPEAASAPRPASPFSQCPPSGNLSIIMENSKELNYKSSSSSGSSCGGATARKSTFFSSHSQWSARGADSFAPEASRSEFRGGRDSLATIRELPKEDRSTSSGEESGSRKRLDELKTHLPTDVFTMDEFESPPPLTRGFGSESKRGVARPGGGLFAMDEFDSPLLEGHDSGSVAKGDAASLSEVFNVDQFYSPENSRQFSLEKPCDGSKLVVETYAKSTIRQQFEQDVFTLKDFDNPCRKSIKTSSHFERKKITEVTVKTNCSLSVYNSLPTGSTVENKGLNYSSKQPAINSRIHEEYSVPIEQYKETDLAEDKGQELLEIYEENDNFKLDVFEQSRIQCKDIGKDEFSLADNRLLEDLDPFDVSLIADLLKRQHFPDKLSQDVYCRLPCGMPKSFKPSNAELTLGVKSTDKWVVLGLLGKGAYAKIIKIESVTSNAIKAIKVQKPSWIWEFYISCEIHRRLNGSEVYPAFMKIEKCVEYNNGTVMFSEYAEHGTLLDAANKMRSVPSSTALLEILPAMWAAEILLIIERLHACRIVHGDIKPDNFLLRRLPSTAPISTTGAPPTLQLIDYGRSIDMSLFPPGTRFTRVVTTKDFQCVEMQTGRPWTYQTDLYGLASTVHCLLFGEYMKVVCVGGRWRIQKKVSRYMKPQLWDRFFDELLNVESCEQMPDLAGIRKELEEYLSKIDRSCLSCFNNRMLNQ